MQNAEIWTYPIPMTNFSGKAPEIRKSYFYLI